MKWAIRTIVILIAAVVVSLATVWLAPSVMPTPNFPGRDRGQFEQRQAFNPAENGNPNANGNAPIRRERGGERGERGGGLFGIVVVLRNFIEVGIVVLPFAIYGAIKQRRRADRRTHLAVSQE